jgi:hypothetical protein
MSGMRGTGRGYKGGVQVKRFKEISNEEIIRIEYP